MRAFDRLCLKIYPTLKDDLYIAGMDESIPRFIRLSILAGLIAAVIFSFGIAIATVFALSAAIYLFTFVVLFPFFFFVFLHLPKFNVERVGQTMNGEVAIIGRRLLIQLESGKSLVNALIDIGMKQRNRGNPLSRIAFALYMGKPLEEIIDESIKQTSSPALKRILSQIQNSLRTGTDLKRGLRVTLEEITNEKIIEFEVFGKKLNTLGLFYMIFGTIAPSLGAIGFVFVLAAVGVELNLLNLSIFLIFVVPVQALFIIVFTKMRPELNV
jgi:Flp pilus assembly protein TadB